MTSHLGPFIYKGLRFVFKMGQFYKKLSLLRLDCILAVSFIFQEYALHPKTDPTVIPIWTVQNLSFGFRMFYYFYSSHRYLVAVFNFHIKWNTLNLTVYIIFGYFGISFSTSFPESILNEYSLDINRRL
jgi:hypothetical protein